MRTRLLFSAFVFLAVTFPASAGTYRFGHDEAIKKIVNVPLSGKGDEKLFLGYKTDTLYVGAGVYVKDMGYVLGIQGSTTSSYYPMPSPEKISRWQAQGLLPNPLPAYSLSIWDYLLGYSTWIILAFVFGFQLFVSWRERTKKVSAS